MPAFFIRSLTRPSTLAMASSMRLGGISRPDTSFGAALVKEDDGLDIGCAGPHAADASKTSPTATRAARFVMGAL
jgi:hypothetical protein